MSSSFTIVNGVRQGAVISPSVFSLYTQLFRRELNWSKIGIQSVLAITPVWDLIETWGFRDDIKDIVADDDNYDNDNDNDDNNNNNNNDKDSNDDKGISALGLDRDMGFLRGHQGRQGLRPHDDDDDEEEDDNEEDDDEVEDNDKDLNTKIYSIT